MLTVYRIIRICKGGNGCALCGFWPLRERLNRTADFAALAAESRRGREAEAAADRLEEALRQAEAAIRGLDPDPLLREREPDAYAAILALCDGGNTPKRPERLEERMTGAVLGRFAGCTLGVPVESWPVERMEALAAASGMAFPPEEYWRQVDRPWDVQYGVDARQRYTRDGMDGVPVDDDITYTLLGLLILEAHGFDFATADVGRMWLERLPCACTAEDVALRNLKAGHSSGGGGGPGQSLLPMDRRGYPGRPGSPTRRRVIPGWRRRLPIGMRISAIGATAFMGRCSLRRRLPRLL